MRSTSTLQPRFRAFDVLSKTDNGMAGAGNGAPVMGVRPRDTLAVRDKSGGPVLPWSADTDRGRAGEDPCSIYRCALVTRPPLPLRAGSLSGGFGETRQVSRQTLLRLAISGQRGDT